MAGLDRYYSFGIRENWLRVYFDYEGSDSFWNTDGDVPCFYGDLSVHSGIFYPTKSLDIDVPCADIANSDVRFWFRHNHLRSDDEVS